MKKCMAVSFIVTGAFINMSKSFWYQAEPHTPFPKLPDKDYLEIQ